MENLLQRRVSFNLERHSAAIPDGVYRNLNMATVIKPAFIGGPGSHCNLKLDTTAGLNIGSQITVGANYTGTVEQFFPNTKVRVRLYFMPAPGSFQPILRATTTTIGSIAITSLSPNTAVHGGAGFTLTVNGTGFFKGCVVLWGTAVRATTFVSSTQVTALILTADIASAGTVAVSVFNPGGSLTAGSNFSIT